MLRDCNPTLKTMINLDIIKSATVLVRSTEGGEKDPPTHTKQQKRVQLSPHSPDSHSTYGPSWVPDSLRITKDVKEVDREKKKSNVQVLVSRTGLTPETPARLIYPPMFPAPLPEAPAEPAGRIQRARHHTHVRDFPSLTVLACPTRLIMISMS